MATERMTPKYPSQGECETKAAIQMQLDINDASLKQLSERVSDLSRQLGFVSLPSRPCEPCSMKTLEPEEMSPLKTYLRDLNLQIKRIIEQIEDLINRLEI